jgi:signal transduction histidine kinase
MSVYAQSALLASIVCLALAIALPLLRRRTPLVLSYVLLNVLLSGWTLANFLGEATEQGVWSRVGWLIGLFLPYSALNFFKTFLGDEGRLASQASKVALLGGVALVPVVLSPWWAWWPVRVALYGLVFGSLYLCVFLIWRHFRSSQRRTESARLLYLAIGGFTAVSFTLVDFVPRWQDFFPAVANTPALGNLMIAFYMYFLGQIVLQVRLLGLSEVVGKIAVLAALVLLLTTLYGGLSVWLGDRPDFAFYTLIVASVLLILFDPMRDLIEEKVNRILFRDRFDFARQLALLRRETANAVEIEELAQLLMRRLRDSRRVTRASLYLAEDDGQSFRCVSAVGEVPARLDGPKERAFVEALRAERAVVREDIQDQARELRGADEEPSRLEELLEVEEAQRRVGAAVSVGLMSQGRLIGVLNVEDERMREAYSAEEVGALVRIAGQAAISVENSRAVQALRDRDRLVALGEMAAGLAHEIRNPLGAIKGAAELLQMTVPAAPDEGEDSPQAFLQIIVEEVNRLNGVVSQFLNYARPYRGEPQPVALGKLVERAAQLWRPEAERWGVPWRIELEEGVPDARADADLVCQILLNLGINAIQATGTPPEGLGAWSEREDAPSRGSGEREPLLRVRVVHARRMDVERGQAREWVEVQLMDNGKGIAPPDAQKLFIPFFTTKRQGTGLGLAVSQRLAESQGGRIEVSSVLGEGSTFRLLLPLA